MQRTDRFQIDLGAFAAAGALVGGVRTITASHELEDGEKTMPFEALLETSHGAELTPLELLRERRPAPEERPADPRGDRGRGDSRSGATRSARLAARLRVALSERQLRLDAHDFAAVLGACEAALVEEAAAHDPDPGLGAEVALSGRLEHLSIDQVLQLTASVASPSRCRLERHGQSIDIYFRGGQVVFARQDNMPEGFTLGRVLAATGAVSQRDVDRWLAHARRPSGLGGLAGLGGRATQARIGQRLLLAGVIRAPELEEGLRKQIEELVFEAVRWTDGRFHVFALGRLPPEAEDAGLSLPLHHLLLEGMRRLDELERMVRELGDPLVVLAPAEATRIAEVLESLRPDERSLLEQVDGKRTMEDLLRVARRPAFDVFRALAQLRGRRLVTVVGSLSSA